MKTALLFFTLDHTEIERCATNINNGFNLVYQNEFNIETSSSNNNNSMVQTKVERAINQLNSNEKLKSLLMSSLELVPAVLALGMNSNRYEKFLKSVANDLKPNLLEYGREFLSVYRNKHDVSLAFEKVLREIFVDSTSSLVINCVKYITPTWNSFIREAFGILFPTFWQLFVDYVYPPPDPDPDPVYWGKIIYTLIIALLQFILMFLLNQCYVSGVLTSNILRWGLSMAIASFTAWLRRQMPVK